jgi:hypothetical protein
MMNSFGAHSFNNTVLTLSLHAQDRQWARLKQYIWPINQVNDVNHSKSSQPEPRKLSGNLCDWSQAKETLRMLLALALFSLDTFVELMPAPPSHD